MRISAFKLNLLAAILIFISFGFTSTKKILIDFNYLVLKPLEYTVSQDEFNDQPFNPPFVGNSFNGFKEALAYRESRGNYFVVNRYGYLGKYQFGGSVLRALGVNDRKEFLMDPKLQEEAFIALLERTKYRLRGEIEKYNGKTINGVTITESGILAAAHLVGAGNVKSYLRSGGYNIHRDGNGVSVVNYLKRFSNYDLSFIEPDITAGF